MTEEPRVRALLIGNWEYTDPEKKLYTLRAPKQNLVVMKDALIHEEFGLCRSEDVTVRENLKGSEIGRALFGLAKDSRTNESLLIYYTGHGERLSDQQLGFCGVDAEHSSLEADSFNTHDLKRWLTTYNRAQSTVIVLDCCYAGQFMSAADPTTVGNSFGAGTAVLMSGGNELVPDSDQSNEPSRYTGALAKVLVDAAIPGSGHFLTVEDVYDALLLVMPKLLPEPWRNVGGKGTLPIARRYPATEDPAAETPLSWWQDDKRFSTVDVHFNCDKVVARWGQSIGERQLDRFDSTRRAAIRRLSQLADAVVRTGPPAEETTRRDATYAVQRAWECVGANLFEAVLPAMLQDHIKAHLDGADDQVIRLRLRFGRDEQALAQYPWEYLQLPPPTIAEPGRRTIAAPLALRDRLIVERCLPAGSPAWDTKQSAPNVGVVNALPFPYSGAGKRLAVELTNLTTVRFVFDLSDDKAGWLPFMDSLEQEPHFLALYLPVRRVSRKAEVGFFQPGRPDWRGPEVLANILKKINSVRAITLVTVAGLGGYDSFRGVIQFASELSEELLRPVFFVCHQPGFEKFVDTLPDQRPQTPCALMLNALSRGKDLHHSFWYARDQVNQRISEAIKPTFGIPGCFLPDDRAPAPQAPGIGGGSPSRSGHAQATGPREARR